MSARAIAALALLALSLLALAHPLKLATGAGDAAPRRPAYARELPPGPGHDIAERGCLACHSAMLITQQHKDSTGWEKTVRQMEQWGAGAAPAERDTLLAYLRRNFGVAAK